MPLSDSIFLRACRREPVPRTPIWLMRQAGRYMPEYRAVRQHNSLLEICRKPELAAEVTITAAERLGVDAAIIFADLLLPLEVMGVPFRFEQGEGPVIETPISTAPQVRAVRTDRAAELGYVAESVKKVVRHFGDTLPVIGFCGAPFTIASYMIEGGSSRSFLRTKRFMYTHPELWDELLGKIVTVLVEYSRLQIAGGASVFQVFDSWVGCLSPADFRALVLPHSTRLVKDLKRTGVPIIYFGTDTATLLPDIVSTGADVVGLDWRTPLAASWKRLAYRVGVQGNLDPALLFAPEPQMRSAATNILEDAAGRPGHIFNLGHGILPETPVSNVLALIEHVREVSARTNSVDARSMPAPEVRSQGRPRRTPVPLEHI